MYMYTTRTRTCTVFTLPIIQTQQIYMYDNHRQEDLLHYELIWLQTFITVQLHVQYLLLFSSSIQINVTKPRLEGKIVWHLFMKWELQLSLIMCQCRKSDKCGHSLIKVYFKQRYLIPSQSPTTRNKHTDIHTVYMFLMYMYV